MLRRLIAGSRRASSAGASSSSSGGEAVASAAEEDAGAPDQEPQDNSNSLFGDDDESIGDLANPSAVSRAEGAVSTPTTGPTPRRQLPLTAAQNPPTESAAAREASAVANAPVNMWDDFSISTVDSDEDWCPSVGEISDIDDDDEYDTVWREEDNTFDKLEITFNGTDHHLEEKYWTETKLVALNLMREWKSISLRTQEVKTMTPNEIMNTFFPTGDIVSLMQLMNRHLVEKKLKPIEFPEFQPFMRSFYWMCYYRCAVTDFQRHPSAYPLAVAEIDRLSGKSFNARVERLNTLLRSFGGHNVKEKHDEGDLYFTEVYSHDPELEKFLRDCGTQASRLAFIRGVTHLLIDDEKMQQRSAKVNDLSMSRSKSDKAYGVVGNCVNSVVLGIPLSCQYTHHGQSATQVLKSNLAVIQGVTDPEQVKMPGSMMLGDRGKSCAALCSICRRGTNFFLISLNPQATMKTKTLRAATELSWGGLTLQKEAPISVSSSAKSITGRILTSAMSLRRDRL